MSFEKKYLKYKNKYLDLKNQLSQKGGASFTGRIKRDIQKIHDEGDEDGIMIMDDYGLLAVPGNTNPIYTYPTRGIDSFLESYQSRYIMLHVAWQLIIQKLW